MLPFVTTELLQPISILDSLTILVSTIYSKVAQIALVTPVIWEICVTDASTRQLPN